MHFLCLLVTGAGRADFMQNLLYEGEGDISLGVAVFEFLT